MTIAFVLAWWHIPTLITFLGLAWSFGYVLPREDGYLAGLGCILSLVPVGLVSTIAWVIAGFCK